MMRFRFDFDGSFYLKLSSAKAEDASGQSSVLSRLSDEQIVSRSVIRYLLLTIVAVVMFGQQPHAQQPVWQPAQGHTQIPIWPKIPPDAQLLTSPETSAPVTDTLVAGKPWTWVEQVSVPTMTVYSPTGKNTGLAIIVFPGGGYQGLAIDLEGSEVCDWLTSRGITCVLLKYRVPFSGPHWEKDCKCQVNPKAPLALEDAQRTIGLVRLHAAEWHIDPHKVGVLGFSAGGYLVAATSVHFDKRVYPETDNADKQSCRPDFAVVLYPGHLMVKEGSLALSPDIAAHITGQTPPTFLLQNEDDKVDSVWDSIAYYAGLKKAGVSVEFHTYSEGGHAFGLRPTKYPATEWPKLVETWLKTIDVMPSE